MLSRASFTAFVKDTTGVTLRQQIPLHRSGAAIFICNYSSADRRVLIENSGDGVTWKNVGIYGRNGVLTTIGALCVPRGVVLGSFYLPDDKVDTRFLRVKLDDTADGDGVFVQIETAAPVPDHPLL